MLTRLGLALFWLLHWLPLPVLGALGRALGLLAHTVARERRAVALVNLELCFPQWSEVERRRVARRHFQALTRSALELGILWWGSKERIQQLVRIEGIEHWDAVRSQPVILLAPHFIGLDMGGIRIGSEFRVVIDFTVVDDFDEIARVRVHSLDRLVPVIEVNDLQARIGERGELRLKDALVIGTTVMKGLNYFLNAP